MKPDDQLIARLARIGDGDLTGQASGTGARTLLEEIVSTPAVQERRRSSLVGLTLRRALVGAVAVTALAGAFLVGPTLFKATGEVYAGQSVIVDRDGDDYLFYITDSAPKPEDLNKAFERLGLNAVVDLKPISPQSRGSFIGLDTEGKGDHVAAQGADDCQGRVLTCVSMFRIPMEPKGRIRLSLGRAAKPGEKYAFPADATWPGEPLAGVNLKNQSVTQAEQVIRGHSLGVAYALVWPVKAEGGEGHNLEENVHASRIDPGWRILEATTYNDGVIVLHVLPSPQTTPPPGFHNDQP
ncbi:hypothetical protein [Rhizohabitans arisaemae]|uniref:hypothetical protein n=1 Tax=Rhizohabitans arisaemae TaxID=2720610 RepID=UPI0024B26065|nr:hypothetical protein [Rhizohabitans arisaemae]